jgi:pseudouridine kinase
MYTEKNGAWDIALIGGATYDITAVLIGDARRGDSNPSRIHTGCGGVGRNIAENLARIGLSVAFVSAFGTDAFSAEMIASCEAVGIDTRFSHVGEGAAGCAYVDLIDSRGELLLAASDMSPVEAFPEDSLTEAASSLSGCGIMVLDANLTEAALARVADCYGGLLIGEAVSVAKAGRLRRILPRLHAVKANVGELAALTGREIRDGADAEDAGKSLLGEGVERVFVTMGREGAFCAERTGVSRVPGFPANVRNVTGAGDAFCAAVAYGLHRGLTSGDILLLGTAMAHITLESPFAVSRDMTEAVALRVMEGYKAKYGSCQKHFKPLFLPK